MNRNSPQDRAICDMIVFIKSHSAPGRARTRQDAAVPVWRKVHKQPCNIYGAALSLTRHADLE